MIPGAQKSMMKGMQLDDNAFVGVEAMINSMTPDERQRPQLIDGSRRRRIASGSGKSVQDVNQLLKQFKMMQKMMKNVNKIGLKGLPMGF
jgi:signal recognition particle subunit SRP54